MKKCVETRRKLFSFLEGDLDAREERAIQTHLEECPACSESLENLRFTQELLTSLPQLEAPSQIWDSLLRRIREKEKAFVFPLRSLLQKKYLIPPASAAACLVLCFSLLFPRLSSPSPGYTIVKWEELTVAEKDRCEEVFYKPLLVFFKDNEQGF